jgi:hypothetical protein
MELAIVHDPWCQGGYNADSDFSAPWPGSETQDKRCCKSESRKKVSGGTVMEACGYAIE